MKKLFQISNEQTEMIQPVLSMSIGAKNFSFAIANGQANQLYYLASFSADDMTPDTIAEILSQHPEASASFYKVAVCYQYSQHVLVPQEYYNTENFSELWKAVYGTSSSKNIVSEPAMEWQLNSVYAIPQDVQQFLSRRYPTASFKHFSTLALKQKQITDPKETLQVNFAVDEFEVIVIKQGQLLLAEQFEYSTPHDVIYYLLNICEQYNLSQYEVQLKISGLVDKDSTLYKELYQYFLNINFREASWSHPDYPLHFFTQLNDIAQCAS
jgi:hypothetical protein